MIGDIKHIVIIESLEDERLTGEELYNDFVSKGIEYSKKDISHKFYNIKNKYQLIELIKYYQATSPYLTGGLLIHLEMHGDEGKAGLILSNGDLIKWEEMVDVLRPINISTANNLFVTMATCHGRYMYQGVDAYKKSPYSGYISASKAIYPSEIIDDFGILFEKLIESGNIVSAYLDMEKIGSNFYYKDSEQTFKESFEMTKNNLDFNEKLSDDIKNLAKQMEIPIDDKIIEFMKERALLDIYNRQKQAFDF